MFPLPNLRGRRSFAAPRKLVPSIPANLWFRRYNAATMSASQVSSPVGSLLIVGVGLIGGSIGLATRQRGLFRSVQGLGRSKSRLDSAVAAGVLDTAIDHPREISAETTLVVLCTPVAHIAKQVRELLPYLPPGALITDAGSTKRTICDTLADLATAEPAFIGSHPIAGSEKQGFEFARGELFAGRTCVVTPRSEHSESVVVRVEQFWQNLGMLTSRMSPTAHDAVLARTSHVPHVVASALAESVTADDLPFTGSGFRDTTRIAAGDPDLWTGILLENAADVRRGIATVIERLQGYDVALQRRDAAALSALLQSGKELRERLAPQEHAEHD